MGEFDINIVKNPEIFEQNRLAAHSDHVCYKNIKERFNISLLIFYLFYDNMFIDVFFISSITILKKHLSIS